MNREEFLDLVSLAIDNLPKVVRKKMSNVEIVVEDNLDPKLSSEMGVRPSTLLGLYQGIPLNQRNVNYGFVLPDKITLFQKPIESICKNREEIINQIRKTLIHEIGHHFGFSETQIRRLLH